MSLNRFVSLEMCQKAAYTMCGHAPTRFARPTHNLKNRGLGAVKHAMPYDDTCAAIAGSTTESKPLFSL